MPGERFSKRFGYTGQAGEIHITDDAPQLVRNALLQIALDVDFTPSQIRKVLCRTMRVAPEASDIDIFIRDELNRLLALAHWFHIYDFVENLYRYAAARWAGVASHWQDEVNEYFVEAGVGWQLIEGTLEVRGSEGFETAVRGGVKVLETSGQETASSELHEAIKDLSRRPDPDATGAVQHGMAALECVAREVTGQPNATLGQIISKFPTLIPKPLDSAVEKAWGYASERGRHIREGGAAERAEAELIVGLAASVSTYLVRKAE
jgi:AbiJ-like protein